MMHVSVEVNLQGLRQPDLTARQIRRFTDPALRGTVEFLIAAGAKMRLRYLQ
jgi:hypothetical protein